MLPVADRHEPYAFRVADRLRPRASAPRWSSAHADSLGHAHPPAKTEKVPYVLVVGDEDVDAGTVGVNRRGSDAPERGVPVDDFVERLARARSSART